MFVELTPSLPFPSTDMESVNPNFVTVATSTTDLLETECNVTEGTWGKDFCHLAVPRPQVLGDFTVTS